jgi:FkbM family methyltransferase
MIASAKRLVNGLVHTLFSGQRYRIKSTKIFGRRMLLYLDQHTSRKIYLGLFERSETEYVRQSVRRGDVCLDVGANVGYFTALFASLGARVIAIEPVRQNAALISLAAALNDDHNVEVICAAVSDRVEEAEFVECMETSVSTLSEGRNDTALLADNYGNTVARRYTIHTISIDSMALLRVDIVKMDIEGYEYHGIRGMLGVLDRLKPRLLMIELVEAHLQRFGSTIHDVLLLLGAHGYQPNVLWAGKLVPYIGQSVPNDNWFFTPTQ